MGARYRKRRRFRDAVGDFFEEMSDVMIEFLVKLGLSAVVAALIWFLDDEVSGIDLPLWACIVIALVVVFGGWFVIVNVSDND